MRPDESFTHTEGTSVFTVGPRHRTPVSDELLATVGHRTTGDQRAALLSREDARLLRDWLTRWLADGWDGVDRICGSVLDDDGRRWVCDMNPGEHDSQLHDGPQTLWRTGEQPRRRVWSM